MGNLLGCRDRERLSNFARGRNTGDDGRRKACQQVIFTGVRENFEIFTLISAISCILRGKVWSIPRSKFNVSDIPFSMTYEKLEGLATIYDK